MGETPEQAELRLTEFIAAATLNVLPGEWSFVESDVASPPTGALAAVRDGEAWSHLVPAPADATERWGLWCFHFAPGLDGSGFVGWLATHLKRRADTRVIVVCGQNSRRGGIFDYWGCPIDRLDRALAVVRELRG
jgi:hypothetical protein